MRNYSSHVTRHLAKLLQIAALVVMMCGLFVSHAQAQASAGQLVISEFRLRGPNGANDEFIEVFNTLNSAHTVVGSGTGTGYGVAASDGLLRCSIPNGTVIPS